MKSEPKKAYVTQPMPLTSCGKAFKVVFTNGNETPLLTKADAEYVLRQSEKYKAISAGAGVVYVD